MAHRPMPYGNWQNYVLSPGAHLLRIDDVEASSFGQLMLHVGNPAQGGIFFGNPTTEHFHISALLALEKRVSGLFGPSPIMRGQAGIFDSAIWTKRGRVTQLLAQLGAPAYAAMTRGGGVAVGKAMMRRKASGTVIKYWNFGDG